jgi:replicative DNA helicase
MADPTPIRNPDKVPPHSIEAEMAIIGSVLIDNQALSILTETLTEEAFYKKAHRDIFRGMLTVAEKGEAIDTITLADELKRQGT